MKATAVVMFVVAFGACRSRPSPPPDDMVEVSAQSFVGDETSCLPATETRRPLNQMFHVSLRVSGYRIDRHLVTCNEFDRCVSAGACTHEAMKCWRGLAAAQREAALAYCGWRGAKLPSWNEWQLAIRGPDGWEYPTGHEHRAEFDAPNTPDGTAFTSPLGVEYRFNGDSFLANELTRDDDCLETSPGFFMAGVVSGLCSGMFHETLDTPQTERGSFRCVRD